MSEAYSEEEKTFYSPEYKVRKRKELLKRIKSELAYVGEKEMEIYVSCAKEFCKHLPHSLGWSSELSAVHTNIKEPDKWDVFYGNEMISDVLQSSVSPDFKAIQRRVMLSIASGDMAMNKENLDIVNKIAENIQKKKDNNKQKVIFFCRPMRSEVLQKLYDMNKSKKSKINPVVPNR